MAEKKTAKENKSVKPIVLRDDRGNVYVLEFNRSTIKFAEARGFKVNTLNENITVSGIEDLFFYAFRMHHPEQSKANTDRILYDELGGLTSEMLERLVDLYLAPFDTLLTSDDEIKNSKMTVEL